MCKTFCFRGLIYISSCRLIPTWFWMESIALLFIFLSFVKYESSKWALQDFFSLSFKAISFFRHHHPWVQKLFNRYKSTAERKLLIFLLLLLAQNIHFQALTVSNERIINSKITITPIRNEIAIRPSASVLIEMETVLVLPLYAAAISWGYSVGRSDNANWLNSISVLRIVSANHTKLTGKLPLWKDVLW